MNKLILLMSSLISLQAFCTTAKPASIEDNIKRLSWNGVEVVYIEDKRFPTYDLTLYFADGALSEKKGQAGLSVHSFNLIDSGTDKLTQQEILDDLEFLGTDFGVSVTHEYTTSRISGLAHDLKKSMTQICSLMRSATYPDAIIKKELELERAGLQSLVSSPSALSDLIFREVSMSNTPYSYPVDGKMADLK